MSYIIPPAFFKGELNELRKTNLQKWKDLVKINKNKYEQNHPKRQIWE